MTMTMTMMATARPHRRQEVHLMAARCGDDERRPSRLECGRAMPMRARTRGDAAEADASPRDATRFGLELDR